MSAIVANPVRRLDWPLMSNNISRADLDGLIDFLRQDDPILTQSKNVRAFEDEWSQWLGVKYSVFMNSGASANLVTMSTLKETAGLGEIIVPTLTWVSDIASVLQCGFKPVFVDINPRTLGMDTEQVLAKISPRTKAVFLTHVLGYNALTQRLLDELKTRGVPLIEDVCESHGATFKGRKLGTYGYISNFSFYYAHHMSTIEGGMVCTNDARIYETARMMRSHGTWCARIHIRRGEGRLRATAPGFEPGLYFCLSRIQRAQHGTERGSGALTIEAAGPEQPRAAGEFKVVSGQPGPGEIPDGLRD